MARAVLLLFSGIFFVFPFIVFAADETQEVPRFDINSYRVEGNTLISNDKVRDILTPFTGKGKDFGTLQEAVEALEKAYHDRGYVAVQVLLPEQEMRNGVVLLKVIEGRVGKVRIDGNKYFGEANIRRSLPELREGEPLNINDISRSLKLANESPAKKTGMQLHSGENEGEVDALLQVQDDKPWKAGINFDNTGDEKTGRFRLGLLFQDANLFNRDHLMTLQYTTSLSQPDHVAIVGTGYHIPFYSLGGSLDLMAAYSTVNEGTLSVATSSLSVSGQGTILGLHYNQNLTRIGNYEHKATLALDYRAYINSVTFQSIQLGNNVTVHPLSLTYAGTYTLNTFSSGFYAGITRNLPSIGSGDRDTKEFFEKVRSGAPEGYNILKLGANVAYQFAGDWQTRLALNSQLTNKPLVPGEQFGVGGAASVRGFDERLLADDDGYSGNYEIYGPNLCRIAHITGITQCRALVFFDAGHVSRINPLPGEASGTTIAGTGPGIRISDGKYFTLSTDYGFVVDPGNTGKPRGSGRWHFAASLMY